MIKSRARVLSHHKITDVGQQRLVQSVSAVKVEFFCEVLAPLAGQSALEARQLSPSLTLRD